MDFSLRLMLESDLDRVIFIERELFSSPWPREAFWQEIENELAQVLEVDGEIQGYVCALQVLDEAEISNVAVSKAYQRRGFGKILVTSMIDDLYSKGCVRIFLEVRDTNIAAIKLYSKMGFELLGARKKYYSDPVEDALVMKCEKQEG